MNIKHVELLNAVLKKVMTKPPVAELQKDREADFIAVAGISITHQPFHQKSINGTVIKPGYCVGYEKVRYGCYDEPPYHEFIEKGVFATFVEAVHAATMLVFENELKHQLEFIAIESDVQSLEMETRAAFIRGYEGHKQGKLITDNPFLANTDKHQLWKSGWEERDLER